jgi:predicted DNA-binding WGR domain protein
LKLVRQARLFFQEGTSDKVYEIDLCESGDGFLVNFRYGRRGASLKEGTKTIFPVPLAEAEKVFAALQQEKRKKGYVAAGEAPIVTTGESKPRSTGTDKRKKAIIKLLKAAVAGEEPEHWSLSRIIWRAGDLKITEAVPHIIQLADPNDPIAIYSVVWTIGRCGTSNAVGFLQNLQSTNKNLPEYLKELITDALLKLVDPKEKERMLSNVVQGLPAPLKTSITAKDYKLVEKQLREYLFELKTASNDYLLNVYRLSRDEDQLHQRFLSILGAIRFERNYFKVIRQIFKTSAMLQDYSTYGVLAKQFEMQSPSQGAFSGKTKAYLTRRVVRQLKKYGDAGENSYVELATNLLLPFNEAEDNAAPFFTSEYRYTYNQATRQNTSQEIRTDYDAYARYQAFSFILFKNSPRYRQTEAGYACIPPYKPGQPAPTAREEAYPHLWNGAAEEIIELLSFARASQVHAFALKVWRANADFENAVDTGNIIHFLQSGFVETQQLGLELARKRFQKNAPDTPLLVAMVDCSLADARTQAQQWIEELKATLTTDTEFIVTLLKMNRVESHAWLRGFLATVSFTREAAQIIVAKVVALMMTASIETEEEKRYINQLGDTVIIAFGDHLKNISLDVIKDLFRHSSADIHVFAGKILMKHDIKPENLPEELLQILLKSDNINSRGIGIALLGKFPDDLLLQRKDVLVSFCLSPLADVRNAVKPIISRLTKTYPEFGNELVNLFVPAFLMKESYEGVHDDLLSLLSSELNASLSIIPKERTLVLLNSRYRASQLIGSVLLTRNVSDRDLSVPELVKLGSNPLQEVRKYAWDAFVKYPDKIKFAKEDALKLAETDWDDTRIFAFEYFRNHFNDSDFTTDMLVMLADSTREDVQDFGREMITKYFNANQGTEYLLKLSQHPSAKVQLFTTAYLEQHASNNIEMLQKLESYFITLLSQVNKGRIAKQRIMDFLRKESLKNEAAAILASGIFTRVSVSVAINERAECIAALRDIQKKFTSLSSPVVVKSISDYVRH